VAAPSHSPSRRDDFSGLPPSLAHMPLRTPRHYCLVGLLCWHHSKSDIPEKSSAGKRFSLLRRCLPTLETLKNQQPRKNQRYGPCRPARDGFAKPATLHIFPHPTASSDAGRPRHLKFAAPAGALHPRRRRAIRFGFGLSLHHILKASQREKERAAPTPSPLLPRPITSPSSPQPQRRVRAVWLAVVRLERWNVSGLNAYRSARRRDAIQTGPHRNLSISRALTKRQRAR
jgi:hypothetical protein